MIHPYHWPVSHGQQTITERPVFKTIVGNCLPHRSVNLHTTGEAIYADDMPSLINVAHAALLLSTESNARVKKTDNFRFHALVTT